MPSHHLKTIAQNTKGRDFAVGDIHGCFTALQDALDAIGFNPKTDRLFSVGDLVDRGPESDQVLDWLAKPWFFAIQGNHDFLTWRHALGDPYPHVDHLFHGGDWLLDSSDKQQEKIGQTLRDLPLAMEVETPSGAVGLIHADCPFDDWQEMHAPLTASAEHICLWSIDRMARDYAEPVKNIRAVIHGHFRLDEAELLGNVHFIDTSGWPRNGHYTFIELESLKLIEGPKTHASYPNAWI